MRVVITTESYLPYLSGVTVSVDAVARGLGALGHEVLVVAPAPASGAFVEPVGSPGPPPRHAWLPSYQPRIVAPPGYRMPWPIPWARAVHQARDFKPDVVHAQSPFVTGLIARTLARDLGAPLIFTHHTRFADYAHYLGPLARGGAQMSERYLRAFWRSCAGIIAPSHDLADAIRGVLGSDGRDRVHVIPTGVDVEAIEALVAIDPRPVAGWPPDAVVVGSLGRLAPEKSPGVVLDSFADAAAGIPSLRLLVVGGGPSMELLQRRAAEPDLAGRVAFTGPLPRIEALRRIAGADLFIFASRTETQGLVLAEALAAGLPAIAVDGPGVRDSVRDGIDGVVVAADPQNGLVDRVASTIAAVATDESRRAEMALAARADAARFATDGRVRDVEALYRSVIADSR